MDERIGIVVDKETYLGHLIVVKRMHYTLPDEVKKLIPDIPKDYYCGYAEILPSDDLYELSSDDVEALLGGDVFGGITYDSEEYGEIVGLPKDKRIIGFDTAHAFQPEETLDTVVYSCKNLVNMIIAENVRDKANDNN